MPDSRGGDGGSGPDRKDRLDSWKEIAAYLARDVTTVQRWEKKEGLPVHRKIHDKLGSVYAFKAELDAWWQLGRPATAGQPEHGSPAIAAGSRLRWLLVALLAVAAAWLLVQREIVIPAADPTRTAAPAATAVAVLPLRNLTGDTGQDWFAEALTEELTAALSRMAGLRVISGITARRYHGNDKTASEIARELGGIGWIVAGSVQRRADHVRISLNIDEAASDRRVWSQSYERPLGESLQVFDELADQIARQIGARAATRTQSTTLRSTNAEAYEAYLYGVYFRQRLLEGGCLRAEPFLLRSIASDASFAPPHAVLGHCYGANRLAGTLSIADGLAKGHTEVARALALDDQLADAHVALAQMRHVIEYDWKGADQSFARALELEPGHAEALVRYGNLQLLTGRVENGLSMIRQGVARSPFNIDYRVILGHALYHLRRSDEALGELARARELDPRNPFVSMWIAQAYALKGEHGRAVAEYLETMRLMPVPGSGPDAVSLLNQAYERAGWQAFWQKELDMAEKGGRDRATSAQPGLRRQAFHWGMARRYARVGAEDRALASLEAAYEARENNLIFLKTEPLFDHLRADPRFQQLVRRVGLNP